MIDEILFQCSNCRQAIKAPPQMSGQTGECPHCGKDVIISPASETATKRFARVTDRPISVPNPSGVPTATDSVLNRNSYVYAGLFRRLGAGLVDNLALYALYAIAMCSGGDPPTWIMGPFYALLILLLFVYYPLMESSSRQATIGKRVFGLKVVDATGHRLTVGRAYARSAGKLLSALPYLVGFLVIGFTEKKRALHDRIAQCLVVRTTHSDADLPDLISLPISAAQHSANLSARHILYGLIAIGFGVGISYGTYLDAQRQASMTGTGTYWMLWGLTLYGVIDLIRGLIGWYSHEMTARGSPPIRPESSNQTLHTTSEPAPGAGSSAREG